MFQKRSINIGSDAWRMRNSVVIILRLDIVRLVGIVVFDVGNEIGR